MSKVLYNITKFITRITKNSKMNNKTLKHYKSQMIHMIMKDTALDYTLVNKLF